MFYRIASSRSRRRAFQCVAVMTILLSAATYTWARESLPEHKPEHKQKHESGSEAKLRLEVHGEWQQGALLKGHVTPGSTVRFLDKSVRVTPAGEFIVGVGRDASPGAAVSVTFPDGTTHDYAFEVAQRDYRIQRIEGVAAKHVNPPKAVLERIRAEAATVWQARQTLGDNLDFLQSFMWPVTGPITGVYGSQRIYNGEPRSPHYGVDIAAPEGTAVQAPAAGIVTLAHPDMYYSGGTLILDHGYGLSSTFIHLHKIHVAVGQRVEQGELIAEVGATGRATGAHLDWRLNWFDQRLDPQLLMAAQGEKEPRLSP